MRVNKFIANNLGISRRKVDEKIQKGLVMIDSKKPSLGQQIDGTEDVKINIDNDWVRVNQKSDNKLILFYKPIFTLVSRVGEKNKKTIYDILPKQYSNLKPAGRLDYMSEGLIVLSTDGDLIYELTHPSNNTEKTYIVSVNKAIRVDQINKSASGLVIDNYKLNPVQISEIKNLSDFKYLKLDPKKTSYQFTLTEGRNNQIRKMCRIFGVKVIRLIRSRHGKYELTKDLYDKKIIEL